MWCRYRTFSTNGIYSWKVQWCVYNYTHKSPSLLFHFLSLFWSSVSLQFLQSPFLRWSCNIMVIYYSSHRQLSFSGCISTLCACAMRGALRRRQSLSYASAQGLHEYRWETQARLLQAAILLSQGKRMRNLGQCRQCLKRRRGNDRACSWKWKSPSIYYPTDPCKVGPQLISQRLALILCSASCKR